MKLPPILGKGIAAELARLEGFHRQVAKRAREQLQTKHRYGHHKTAITAGCPSCGREVSLFMLRAFEPPRDTMEFFR